jgi:hypothetical protein
MPLPAGPGFAASVVNLFPDLLTNPLRPAACILDNFQRFATLRARVRSAHARLLRIRTHRIRVASMRLSRANGVRFAACTSSRDATAMEK